MLGKIFKICSNQYQLENYIDILKYDALIKYFSKNKKNNTNLAYNPKFSVIIPVYNIQTIQLKECIDSVINQTYENYELILIDDCSTWKNVKPVLKEYEYNNKVKIIFRNENGHISTATNDGIFASTGDFIIFMDCDDTIELDALYCFAEKLNENRELDFIYSDEDKITEDGAIRHMPFFKPDWSPDLFMCMMYTNHLGMYRASIVKEINGLRSEYNGSQDYDFTLRFMEKSDNTRVGHISKILYHWRERKESVACNLNVKSYAEEAGIKARKDALIRRGIDGKIEEIAEIHQCRVVYNVIDNPKVSIIIPSKDNPDILFQCIDSIIEKTNYKNFEIIVVDNGSNDYNKIRIKEKLSINGCKYVYDKCSFNFSYMCNRGVQESSGEYLLFLNDDVEIIQPTWLELMLGHAQQKYIGAVGSKMFYPNSTRIQHCGVVNLSVGPSHVLLKKFESDSSYFAWHKLNANFIAVTGACLLVSREKYEIVDGFDEKLPVAYNDVDFCFKLYEHGYYNVMRNDVIAYHHESYSRGNDVLSDKKMKRLAIERNYLYKKHSSLQNKDPFYSKIFDGSVDFTINDNLFSIGIILKTILKILYMCGKCKQSIQKDGCYMTFKKIKNKIGTYMADK